MASAVSSAVAAPALRLPLLLLLALVIACAAAHDDGGGDSICAEADCGRGTCVETMGWVPWRPSYKCECDPGWTRPIKMVAFAPCNVPECSFNSSCFNLGLLLPRGIPLTDPCVAVNCGPGTCTREEGFHYRCDCEPGHVNVLKDTKFPCVDGNCLMGMHCPALDDPAPSSPPPPPAPTASPAPPGSVPVQSLLQQLLLLLASLAMARVM